VKGGVISMGEAKPWQIGIVVLGLLVLVGSVVYQCSTRQTLDFAQSITFVDVKTGELWVSKYNADRSVMYPVKSPKSGVSSLFPVTQEAGAWTIEGRYLEVVVQDKLASEGVVNLKDGTVKAVGEPTKFDMFAR
jgi:hypothetical protein